MNLTDQEIMDLWYVVAEECGGNGWSWLVLNFSKRLIQENERKQNGN